MTITGYQFDRMRVTPQNDALLYSHLSDKQNRIVKGYRNELKVQASGLNVYVDTGAALIAGRLVEITEQETVLVGANSTGYIVLTIDLSQTNTSEGTPGSEDYTPINNQVRCEAVGSLVQQDIMNDGKVFTYPLATYSASGTSVSVDSSINDSLPVTLMTGFENYSTAQKVRLIKDGRTMHLMGAVKNIAKIDASAYTDVLKVPKEYAPKQNSPSVQFGSGKNTFNSTITSEGVLTIGRYGVSSYIDIEAGSWLTLKTSWSLD